MRARKHAECHATEHVQILAEMRVLVQANKEME